MGRRAKVAAIRSPRICFMISGTNSVIQFLHYHCTFANDTDWAVTQKCKSGFPVLRLIARMQHYASVISLFKRLDFLGIRSDFIALGVVLNCYYELEMAMFGFSILGKMFDYRPDEVTYSTMTKGLSRVGNNSAAIDLLDIKNFLVSIVGYNTTIDGLCKSGLVSDVLNLFRAMLGKGIFPGVVSHTSLIAGVCGLGQFREARRLLSEMRDKGIEPDLVTYGILVNE
ncbi:Pentatricopeptide repeat [Dillenia turbinata]|uniref:Pentatricopeptide repeat n=1 Tax=Dillenia turbinata TaxID=194707 RepID=A0AAN8YVI6_9MAGN